MAIVDYNPLLDIFINNLVPETQTAVNKGNKIFGAFIIKKSDLSLLITGTNNEIINPLYHGEITTLFNFFESSNFKPKDYYFISSHEPCSLCLSAITWSGFDNFYYFFPYKDTNISFNIPHDLDILKEVFQVNEGKYSHNNKYWKSFSIIEEIKKNEHQNNYNLSEKIEKIKLLYRELSNKYQNSKISNNIPLK